MGFLSRLAGIVVLLAALWPGFVLAEAPKVVVSIKPLHALVSGVMAGVETPYLIVKGTGSPHTHALKPSDAKAIAVARIVFWFGEELEQFLERPLDALAGSATIVTMAEAPGLKRLTYREGGLFADHEGEREQHGSHGHDGRGHGAIDMHLWLDPDNAVAMVRAIEKALSEADPGNSARYAANAKALLERLDRLDSELAKTLAPVIGKQFIVFHDSYQYFEARYGVPATGSLAVNPEVPPGAAHLKAIRAAMIKHAVSCIFIEPQFDPGRVKALVTGIDVRTGILDPLGSSLEPGPDLYFELMRSLAKNLADCLSGAG